MLSCSADPADALNTNDAGSCCGQLNSKSDSMDAELGQMQPHTQCVVAPPHPGDSTENEFREGGTKDPPMQAQSSKEHQTEAENLPVIDVSAAARDAFYEERKQADRARKALRMSSGNWTHSENPALQAAPIKPPVPVFRAQPSISTSAHMPKDAPCVQPSHARDMPACSAQSAAHDTRPSEHTAPLWHPKSCANTASDTNMCSTAVARALHANVAASAKDAAHGGCPTATFWASQQVNGPTPSQSLAGPESKIKREARGQAAHHLIKQVPNMSSGGCTDRKASDTMYYDAKVVCVDERAVCEDEKVVCVSALHATAASTAHNEVIAASMHAWEAGAVADPWAKAVSHASSGTVTTGVQPNGQTSGCCACDSAPAAAPCCAVNAPVNHLENLPARHVSKPTGDAATSAGDGSCISCAGSSKELVLEDSFEGSDSTSSASECSPSRPAEGAVEMCCKGCITPLSSLLK
jgi:hypothetical protein